MPFTKVPERRADWALDKKWRSASDPGDLPGQLAAPVFTLTAQYMYGPQYGYSREPDGNAKSRDSTAPKLMALVRQTTRHDIGKHGNYYHEADPHGRKPASITETFSIVPDIVCIEIRVSSPLDY